MAQSPFLGSKCKIQKPSGFGGIEVLIAIF
jgi:hypothetical protein